MIASALRPAEHFVAAPGDRYRDNPPKWDGDRQVTYETFRDMGIAYGLGLVLMYLLAGAQFGAYVTRLVIMAPIPLTPIAVMPGRALPGQAFTATSMIGRSPSRAHRARFDPTGRFRPASGRTGRAVRAEGIIDAAAVRAKIALTGLAAMLGAIFMVHDPIFNGFAISLAFRILVSTLLTLTVFPVLYSAVKRRPYV